MSHKVNTIVNLPGELLEEVFRHLTYSEVASVRPVCKKFNTTGRYMMAQVLHEIRKNLDSMLNKFTTAEWFRNTNHNKGRYIQRLRKGASSLMVLSVIVNTADAATYHFIRAGILPTLSAHFVDKVERAVNFATHRNPLVGKARMYSILEDIVHYLSVNFITADIPFDSTAVFRTIIDLLNGFSRENEKLEPTDFGLHYQITCVYPLACYSGTEGPPVQTELNAKMMIFVLAVQKLEGVWLLTDLDHANMLMTSSIYRFCDKDVILHKAMVNVWCEQEDKTNVTNVQHLLHIQPKAFSVELFGSLTFEVNSDLEPKARISYIYHYDGQNEE